MCQKASGGPLGALVFINREDLRVTKEQLRVFASTSRTQRQFCENCGSPVFFVRTNRPERIAIFAGSLDDQTGFSPTMHVCAETAVPQLRLADGRPRHGQKPPGGSPTVGYDPTTGRVVEGTGEVPIPTAVSSRMPDQNLSLLGHNMLMRGVRSPGAS